MRDPEDTIPPPPSSRSSAPPPPRALVTLEELGAIVVDDEAITLARWCAGWARRGYAIEDLVGVVHDCRCTTKVFPRADLPRRYAPGTPVREALASAGSRPGRLTVAAFTQDGCPTYHPSIPSGVEAPDTRGLLEPLSAKRRQWLEDYVERAGDLMRRCIEKEVLSCGQRIDDALVMVDFVWANNWRAWPKHNVSIEEHEPFVDAAEFEAIPYHVMVLFQPDDGEGYAAGWVAPERLGFEGEDLKRLICRERWAARYPDVREAP
jgi:hypothetical protein